MKPHTLILINALQSTLNINNLETPANIVKKAKERPIEHALDVFLYPSQYRSAPYEAFEAFKKSIMELDLTNLTTKQGTEITALLDNFKTEVKTVQENFEKANTKYLILGTFGGIFSSLIPCAASAPVSIAIKAAIGTLGYFGIVLAVGMIVFLRSITIA